MRGRKLVSGICGIGS